MVRAARNMQRGSAILAYMSKHPGRVFTTNDIMSEMKFPSGERGLVGQTISRLAHEAHELESPMKGAYVWRGGKAVAPPKVVIPKLYEYVGTLTSGDVIVKGEDEGIYKLERM